MLVPIWNGLSTDRSDLEWSVLTILRWSSLLLPSWVAKSRKIKSALLSNCSVGAYSTLEWFFYWPFQFGIVFFFIYGLPNPKRSNRPFSLLLPWCLIFFGMVCPWTVPLCNSILPSWAATIENGKTRASLYCSPNAYSALEWSIHWLFHFGKVFCLHGLPKKSNEVKSVPLWLLPWCMFLSGMICLLTIPLWNSLLFSFMGCQNREQDIRFSLECFVFPKAPNVLIFSQKSCLAFSLTNKTFQFSSECVVSPRLQMCKGLLSLLLLFAWFCRYQIVVVIWKDSFESQLRRFRYGRGIWTRSCHSCNKVLGFISGAWIQETNLRSSMGTHRETEIGILGSKSWFATACFLDLEGKAIDRFFFCERHTQRAIGDVMDENRKQTWATWIFGTTVDFSPFC
jgi:hypothetical protein